MILRAPQICRQRTVCSNRSAKHRSSAVSLPRVVATSSVQPRHQQLVRKPFDKLVVVEGLNDMRAVRRAVNADVFVLGTATQAGDSAILGDLREAAARGGGGVVVLMDPDVAGRQARNILDERLGGCWHAFIPAAQACAEVAVRSKEAGNIGIEHAPPAAIWHSLATLRPSDAARVVFTREMLQELGLIAIAQERSGKVTERRALVCDFLGVGACDGKQLLRQLNRYNFTQQELAAALQWADGAAGLPL